MLVKRPFRICKKTCMSLRENGLAAPSHRAAQDFPVTS
jgi:hypothetical protein